MTAVSRRPPDKRSVRVRSSRGGLSRKRPPCRLAVSPMGERWISCVTSAAKHRRTEQHFTRQVETTNRRWVNLGAKGRPPAKLSNSAKSRGASGRRVHLQMVDDVEADGRCHVRIHAVGHWIHLPAAGSPHRRSNRITVSYSFHVRRSKRLPQDTILLSSVLRDDGIFSDDSPSIWIATSGSG